ncbi:MAG TPA: hypothetical protein VLO00_00435, partial [Cryobacterium sp.]|nr:hypothetical protein [Cryobacterium sp.]
MLRRCAPGTPRAQRRSTRLSAVDRTVRVGQSGSPDYTRQVKVLAAMSGGVDSAVAAARMVEAGHEVVGVHLAL